MVDTTCIFGGLPGPVVRTTLANLSRPTPVQVWGAMCLERAPWGEERVTVTWGVKSLLLDWALTGGN